MRSFTNAKLPEDAALFSVLMLGVHLQVQLLTGMGFQADQARQALIAANGDIARAVQILTTSQH